MTARHVAALFLVCGVHSTFAGAHAGAPPQSVGDLVALDVQVDGDQAPLYPAADGTSRYYLEARRGAGYEITLANRSGERLGAVLTVDGLNVISGERDQGVGRMYVLDPWQRTTVRGWRSSLDEVHAFTFVDEKRSYATRSGKANAKMGWIELFVYRERRRIVQQDIEPRPPLVRRHAEAPEPPPVQAGSPAWDSPVPATRDKAARGEAEAAAETGANAQSYPGTGWGRRTHDPVVLVSFAPEPQPCKTVTLRYEYRAALVALGVLAPHTAPRDRLWRRDHAEMGFARPPLW